MSRHDMTTRRFKSLREAALYAMHTPRIENSKAQSEHADYGYDWSYNVGLDECLNKLHDGYIWQEGVDKLSGALDVTESLAARSELPRVVRNIIGGSISMGAYVTGDPRCMRRRTKQPAVEKPVLSVAIPIGAACGVTARQRANFGAAILSACNVLERAGYRVEIDAIWRIGCEQTPYKNWFNMEVEVKGARDRLNPAAFAFAVMHASMLRKWGFRVAETVEAWRPTVNNGYGQNTNGKRFHASLAADYDLYFDNMDYTMSHMCSTPEGAFKYVEDVVNRQLKQAAEVAA